MKYFMRIKLPSGEDLQCWVEGTERDTEVLSHGHPANYFLHCSCELQKSDEAMGERGIFLVITSYILKVNAVICNTIQLSQQFSAKS